jgi:S-adenosylmethionine hydrolase
MRTPTGHYLVGPDNGLLMPSAERLGGISRAVELQTPRGASTTFHGRDVFAPAAARLANGTALDQLGPPTENFVPGSLPKPEDDSGEIIHVDTYGNLVTNFAARDISGAYALELGDRVIPLKRYYAEVAPGELLALVGSAGFVEISVRDGDAAKVTGAGSGRRVRLVSRQPPPG